MTTPNSYTMEAINKLELLIKHSTSSSLVWPLLTLLSQTPQLKYQLLISVTGLHIRPLENAFSSDPTTSVCYYSCSGAIRTESLIFYFLSQMETSTIKKRALNELFSERQLTSSLYNYV